MKPQYKKIIVLATALFLIVFIGVVVGLVFYFPVYAEKKLIPTLAKTIGADSLSLDIRRIGLTGADIGPIYFDPKDKTAPSIGLVQIDYSPGSLWNKRIKGITISGLTVSLSGSEQGISINGLHTPHPKASHDETASKPSRSTELTLPVTIDHIRIKDSVLICRWRERAIRVPIEMDLHTNRLSRGIVEAALELLPRSQRITLSVDLNLRKNHGNMYISCKRFLMDSFGDFWNLMPDFTVTGETDLQVDAGFKIQPFKINHLSLKTQFNRIRFLVSDVEIKNIGDGEDKKHPIDFTMASNDMEQWNFELSSISVVSPLPLQVLGIKGTLMRIGDGWKLSAKNNSLFSSAADIENLILSEFSPVRLDLDLGARFWDVGKIDFYITSDSDKRKQDNTINFRSADINLIGQGPDLTIKGSYEKSVFDATATASFSNIKIDSPGRSAQAPKLLLSGQLLLKNQAKKSGSHLHFDGKISNIKLTQKDIDLAIGQLSIAGDIKKNQDQPLRVKGNIELVNGSLSDHQTGLSIQTISANLPLSWPNEKPSDLGSLQAKQIYWKSHHIGLLSGTLQQEVMGLKWKLKHPSKLFPGLIVLSSGRADTDGFHASFRIPKFSPNSGIELESYLPSAKGMRLNGGFQAMGEIVLNQREKRAFAKLKYEEGLIENMNQEWSLSGINLNLTLSDLFLLRSMPKQKLSISKISAGNLMAENLWVDFQIEPNFVLFVEKGEFKWCEGNIATNAIRITPGVKDYQLTLVCDRLKLAEVLKQLGTADASGNGTVNGRIPVSYVDGQIGFDNGFLYSTPGQSGTIKLSDTDFILAGLPPGTPQYTQIDLTLEALKDYSYKWAKVHLNSEKEDLLLKLQLDGKPNRLLPFSYDQQSGQFQRISGTGNAEFEGISVDMNFRVPLNEIMEYKDYLNIKDRLEDE